jgi:hypothetical protein
MSTKDRQEARGLLDEVAEIKSTTRAQLYAIGWQWLVIWAVAFFGAALTAMVPVLQPYADVYWMFATPISLVLTAVVSTRVESRSPVRQRSLPYWLVGAGIAIGTFGVSLVLPDEAIVVVVWVILGFGFAAFAWLERAEPAAWLLAGMAVVSGALGLIVEDTFALYPALALAFSAALAGVITGMRIQSKR